MSDILIVSRWTAVGAMLADLLRGNGYAVELPAASEPSRAAIARAAPKIVVLDCDDTLCSAPIDVLERETRTTIVLFSPSRHPTELARIAAEKKARHLTLPISGAELSKVVDGLMR